MVAQFVWKGEMNNRRKLLVALGGGLLTAPLAAFAQQPRETVPRIGLIALGRKRSIRYTTIPRSVPLHNDEVIQ